MLIGLFNFDEAYANSNNNNNNDTLILYEQVHNKQHYNSIDVIKNQLSNYSNGIDTLQIDSYKKNTIDKYDYIFVINIQSEIKKSEMILDLANTNKRIYWIGEGIHNLTSTTEKYSIAYSDKDSLISKITNGKEIKSVDNNNMYNIIEITDNKVKVIASMTDGYNEYPYIIKDKHLFYIIDSDVRDNEIFLNSLNDFFEKSTTVMKHTQTDIKEFESSKDQIKREDLFEQRIKAINDFIVIFIAFIIGIFTIIYFKFRKININKFKIDKGKTK